MVHGSTSPNTTLLHVYFQAVLTSLILPSFLCVIKLKIDEPKALPAITPPLNPRKENAS